MWGSAPCRTERIVCSTSRSALPDCPTRPCASECHSLAYPWHMHQLDPTNHGVWIWPGCCSPICPMMLSSNSCAGEPIMMHAVARVPQTSESETIYVRRSDVRTPALPQAALKILAAFDGQRTVAEVSADAQISVSQCLAVVKKLSAMGVLDISTA